MSALRQAAHTWYYAGRQDRAKQMLEDVATRAEQLGDFELAGDSFIAALIIAVQRNDPAEARRLLDRVIILTSTPAMPDRQRVALLQRVAQPLVLASRAR